MKICNVFIGAEKYINSLTSLPQNRSPGRKYKHIREALLFLAI